MIDLKNINTEQRNTKTMNLHEKSAYEIVKIMNDEDRQTVQAVQKQLDKIAQAVQIITKAFEIHGRLFYIGAGTSGRLGVLDAVECVPTFGVPENQVIGLIAGGEKAFIKAVEGAEDSMEEGKNDLQNMRLQSKDVVVGIAASGRTPYVIGGLKFAKEIGCQTISVTCTYPSEIGKISDISIEVVPGPEIVTGSTRLKAGTCQKMILNMLSTASMIGIGKVYQNLMVDVLQTNKKLETRAQNIVMEVTNLSREEAIEILKQSHGSAKTAIVATLFHCSPSEAEEKLNKANGKIQNIK